MAEGARTGADLPDETVAFYKEAGGFVLEGQKAGEAKGDFSV